MDIFAPYNFVSLNQKVWFPDWGKQVSHDIPFSDGVSGIIYYELINKTPIVVGGTKLTDKRVEFMKGPDGQPIIPGSSIRGIIRNIHEILCFSKLKTKTDRHFSVRDPYLKEYRDVVFMKTIINRIKYAWLKKEDGKFKICIVKATKVENKDIANVITGGGPGKDPIEHYFVFERPYAQSKWEEVSKEDMERFELAHTYVNGETFVNYKRTISKAKEGDPQPIFIVKYNQKQYFGVCKYMRIPYDKSIGEKLPENHLSENPDMTELLFGYTNNSSKLKSRIQFSHLKLEGDPEYGEWIDTVLASPKPSYYPTYIEQKGHPSNTLYSYNTGQIRGFKRYPVHKSFNPKRAQQVIPDSGEAAENEDIRVTFQPLKPNHKFTGKIVFHNLKLIELGSLISALTFHGNKDCRHAIGMAKPLGYGKCSITIAEKSFFTWNNDGKKENINIAAFLDEFEDTIKTQLSKSEIEKRWKALFTMAKEYDILPKNETYMTIQEHKQAKKDKKYLKPYEELVKQL